MPRVVKLICFVLVLFALPLWLLMVGLSPMLFDAGPSNMSKLQKLTGSGIIAGLWLVAAWVIYYGWRTIRTWASDSVTPAMLMALPAVVIGIMFAMINFGNFAP